MMLSMETARKMAKLSAIGFTEDELVSLKDEMQLALDKLNVIKEVNINNVPQTVHIYTPYTVLREDKEIQEYSGRELLASAPVSKHGYYAVPKIRD